MNVGDRPRHAHPEDTRPPTGPTRTFRRMFREQTTHVASLSRVATEAWWDGELLIVLRTMMRRRKSSDDWADSEERLVSRSITEAVGEAAALRRALALHDERVAEYFKFDDAACATADDDEPVVLAHCGRDPSVVGACGGTDATCSCECNTCVDPR